MVKPLYRGQDIGGRRRLTATCMNVLNRIDKSDLYSVLPHICLIRSECFLRPLMRLLDSSRSHQLFAAIALGSLGDSRAVPPLAELLARPESLKGPGCQSLQTALIVALGETGADEAIEPLLRVFRVSVPRDGFASRRRQLVVTALGTLAQHGSRRAVQWLLEATGASSPEIRSRAVGELGAAYWSRPNALPKEVRRRMTEMLEDSEAEVREAAEYSLFNLAQLGCREAELIFGGRG